MRVQTLARIVYNGQSVLGKGTLHGENLGRIERTYTMTELLLQAITEAKQLPEWEQDALAAMILDEIADNQKCTISEMDIKKPDLLVKLVEQSFALSVN